MKKIMIDTDVLLNLLEKKDPEYKSVAKILSEKNKLKVKVFFSTITLLNIMDRLSEEKSVNETREIMRRLLQLGKAIDADDKVFGKAMNSSSSNIDFALQFNIADEHNMDYIISSYVPKRQIKKLPVLNADQFLNVIK